MSLAWLVPTRERKEEKTAKQEGHACKEDMIRGHKHESRDDQLADYYGQAWHVGCSPQDGRRAA